MRAVTWANLENIRPSETSQTQKVTRWCFRLRETCRIGEFLEDSCCWAGESGTGEVLARRVCSLSAGGKDVLEFSSGAGSTPCYGKY